VNEKNEKEKINRLEVQICARYEYQELKQAESTRGKKVCRRIKLMEAGEYSLYIYIYILYRKAL